MSSRSRTSKDITFDLLKELNAKGKASKWDLEKILGTISQFDSYVTNLLLKYKLIEVISEGHFTFYRKTPEGELFHDTLRKDNIIMAYRRISGRRLKREVEIDQRDLRKRF